MLRFKKVVSMIICLFLVLGIILVPGTMTKASETWTYSNINLQGMGFVTTVSIHPIDGNLIYAGTDVGGAYRWDTTAQKWIPITDSLPIAGVEGLAPDPTNTNNVYIVCDYKDSVAKLFKSSDKGATWNQLTGFPSIYTNSNGQFRWSGKRLIVDPNGGGNVLYFTSRRDGLWKSTNAGSSWTQVSTAILPTGSDEANKYYGQTFVVVDKNSGNSSTASQTVYVGVQKYGVYKSTDAGSTWTLLSGAPATTYKPICGAVGSDGALYVTYSNAADQNSDGTGYIYKFLNGTTTNITPTSKVATGFAGIDVVGTTVVANQWNCGDTNGIHYSTNGGSTWSEPSLATRVEPKWYPSWSSYTWMAHMAINPQNTKNVWFGDGFGTYEAKDITTPTWIAQMKGLEELCGGQILVPPVSNGAEAFVFNMDKIGFRIADRNSVPLTTIYPGNFGISTGSDYCASNPNVIAYVGSQQNLSTCYARKSTDNGVTWTDLAKPQNFTNGNIAISATDANRMVWFPLSYYWNMTGQPNPQPVYSTNGGSSWTACTGLPTTRNDASEMYAMSNFMTSDRINGNIFYYYLYDGLTNTSKFYRSTNGGAAWSLVTTNIALPANYKVKIKAVPGKEGELFLNLYGGDLYKSTDYGTTWNMVSGVSNVKAIGFGQINSYGPVMYLAGNVGSGIQDIYRSEDYGSTWTQLVSNSAKIPAFRIVDISGDLRDPNKVVFSTDGRGFMVGMVNVPVTGIIINNKPTSNLTVGTQYDLNTTITPSNASNQNVSWTSSNTSVATVNGDGIISALAAGTTTITARTEEGGFTDSCTVTVDPTNNLVLNPGYEFGMINWTTTGTCAIVTDPHTGSNAVKVSGGRPAGEVSQTFAVTPNSTYTVTVWTKGGSNSTVGVRGYGSSVSTTATASNWTLRTLTFTTGATATTATVYCTCTKSGQTVTADDWNVVKN